MLNFYFYPEEVKKEIRKDTNLKMIAPNDKKAISLMISSFIIYTIIFIFFGLIFKRQLAFKDFADMFLFFLFTGEIINIFKFFIIDLLWWPNTKRIRFSIIPFKEPYQNHNIQLDIFLKNIPLFIVIAFFTAFLMQIIGKYL